MQHNLVGKFIRENSNHDIVTGIIKANKQRDRVTFTALYREIEKHMYTVKAISELRECNCIDCLGEIELLKDNLIII